MIKLGVTGGIGSGKSLVCSIISAMGYPIFNADSEARRIVESDFEVISAIKNLFGDGIYLNGYLDRKRVAEIVFSNPTLLEELNSIIHPAVANHFDHWVFQYRYRSLVVKEAAILFESGANRNVDKTLVVTAPLDVRIKRVIERDGLNREEILSRMNNQFTQDELVKRCDLVIENDSDQLILPQIVKVLNDILKGS
jgi:dephospho-CoA kinase